MKKLTIFGFVFSVILLVLYASEGYNFINTLFATPGTNVSDVMNSLFTIYPWWWSLCTIGIIISGCLASIFYWFQSAHSVECAYSSLGLYTLRFILQFIFRYRLFSYNGQTFVMAVGVIILSFAFATYLSSRKEDEYSSTNPWKFLGSR